MDAIFAIILGNILFTLPFVTILFSIYLFFNSLLKSRFILPSIILLFLNVLRIISLKLMFAYTELPNYEINLVYTHHIFSVLFSFISLYFCFKYLIKILKKSA